MKYLVAYKSEEREWISDEKSIDRTNILVKEFTDKTEALLFIQKIQSMGCEILAFSELPR